MKEGRWLLVAYLAAEPAEERHPREEIMVELLGHIIPHRRRHERQNLAGVDLRLLGRHH